MTTTKEMYSFLWWWLSVMVATSKEITMTKEDLKVRCVMCYRTFYMMTSKKKFTTAECPFCDRLTHHKILGEIETIW